MCHQIITSFLCRCQRMEEHECDYARELDVIFWRKIECPYYSAKRLTVYSNCGAGAFYCGATDDGKVFDAVDVKHQKAKAASLAYNCALEKQKQILLEKRDDWVANGGLPALFASSLGVRAYGAAMTRMNQEQMKYHQEAFTWAKVKALAKSHFDIQQSRQLQGLPPATSFADFLEQYHPQVYARISERGASQGSTGNESSDLNSSATTGTIPATSRHLAADVSHSAPQQPPSAYRAGGIALEFPQICHQPNPLSSHVRPKEGMGGEGAGPIDATALQAQQMAAQDAIPEVRVFQQKRARAKKQAGEAPSSPDKPADGVRRSTRVKGKQVNYALDDTSEQSRSPSPEKSEASTFSPETSDITYTPGRGRVNIKKESSSLRDSVLGRNNALLADQIGEWRRHDRRAASPHTPAITSRSRKRTAEDGSMLQQPRTRVKHEPAAHHDHAWAVNTGNVDPTTAVPQDLLDVYQTRQTLDYAGASFHAGPQVKSEVPTTCDPTKRPATAPTPPHSRDSTMSGPQALSGGLGITTPGSAMPNPLAAGTLKRSSTMPLAYPAQQRRSSVDHLSALRPSQNYQTGLSPRVEQDGRSGMMNRESSSGPPTVFDDHTWPQIDWKLLD